MRSHAPPRVRRASLLLKDEREQREDSALAAVVGSHDEDDVLDRDDEAEEPDDQRQDAVDVGRRRRDRMLLRGEALLKRVQRARADVAVDDAERGQREDREALAGGMRLDVMALRAAPRRESRSGASVWPVWPRKRRRGLAGRLRAWAPPERAEARPLLQ